MIDHLFAMSLYISPVVVCALSLRRFAMSRSRNVVLYAALCGFCLVALAGKFAGASGSLGHVSTLMACLALPLWLVLRELARRPAEPGFPAPPAIFASSRTRA